jgi:hypothetical protein
MHTPGMIGGQQTANQPKAPTQTAPPQAGQCAPSKQPRPPAQPPTQGRAAAAATPIASVDRFAAFGVTAAVSHNRFIDRVGRCPLTAADVGLVALGTQASELREHLAKGESVSALATEYGGRHASDRATPAAGPVLPRRPAAARLAERRAAGPRNRTHGSTCAADRPRCDRAARRSPRGAHR